jgi:hypothetical protein
MCGDPSLAGCVGKLTVVVAMLLQLVDECPVALDPFHEIVVNHARRALADPVTR